MLKRGSCLCSRYAKEPGIVIVLVLSAPSSCIQLIILKDLQTKIVLLTSSLEYSEVNLRLRFFLKRLVRKERKV